METKGLKFLCICVINLCFTLQTLANKSGDIKFKVNTAALTVYAESTKECDCNFSTRILTLSDICVSCDFYNTEASLGNAFLVESRWPVTVKIESTFPELKKICNATKKFSFGERGTYQMNLSITKSNSGQINCSIQPIIIKNKPPNSNLPILVAFLILLALSLIYTILDYWYGKKNLPNAVSLDKYINTDLGQASSSQSNLIANTENGNPTHLKTKPVVKSMIKERLTSIDSFRGMCIVIMIFVNYGGGQYWFFTHSIWNGLTVADLVFPWFMYIMGINIVFSINSQVSKSLFLGTILYKIIRRTVILFGLGIFIINGNEAWYNMRIPGVLQRFAISYLIVSLMQLFFHVTEEKLQNNIAHDLESLPWWYPVRDIVLYWQQWLFMVILEVLFLSLTFALPVPGCPTGYLGPGGRAENGSNYNCTGGAAGYIDRVVFGEKHIFSGPTCKEIYFPSVETVYYDPEGLLGSINSCLIVFFGLQAGKIFFYYKGIKQRIVRFLTWFIILGTISAILTKCSINDGWIPVNKNLWSVTFVTTLSSMAFFIIPFFYYVIDVKNWWTGAPLFYPGMNSILVYVGHETFQKYLPFSWGADDYSTHAEWLAMNLLGVSYWVLIAYYSYKVNFFLKI